MECSLQLYGLNDGTAGEDWDENTITYDNAPTIPGDGNAATQDLDTTNLTLLATFHVEGSGVSTHWNPAILSFLQADTDGRVTFVLYQNEDGNRNVYFATKEHASAMVPTLTVTDVGLLSTCGDTIVEGSEQCDDGGTGDGDGCSSTCQYETGPCDDGLFCNTGETWTTGTCGGGSSLSTDDGVDCTDDSCDEVTDCFVHTPNDTNCEDALFCNGAETCDLMSDCQAGTAPITSDGVACTDDSCDEATDSIVNTASSANCEDGDECTADACDEISGCSNTAIPECSVGVPAASRWGDALIVVLVLATTIVTFRRQH